MRRAPIALAIALVVAGVVAVVVLTRPPMDLAAPSPSPSASVAATASPSLNPSPTASPTASPTPTPQGLYVSKRLAFALTLPTPWREASCGNFEPAQGELPIAEQFTSAPVMEELIGDAGAVNDRVDVRLEGNAEALTPTQFVQRRFRDATTSLVTFAGRPAVEVRTTAFGPGDAIIYVFAEGDRMYSVSALPTTSALPDMPTMLAILRSFRLLSTAERQGLPDPTLFTTNVATAQALAGTLKTAFEQRDPVALERVLGPCVSQGVVPGGGTSEPRERFIAELRQQLAAGVVVVVDTSAVLTETRGDPYSYVWSKWNASTRSASPGPQTYNVQLILRQASGGGFYWSGTLLVHSF